MSKRDRTEHEDAFYCRYCGRTIEKCRAEPCVARRAHYSKVFAEESGELATLMRDASAVVVPDTSADASTAPLLRVTRDKAPQFMPVPGELWIDLICTGALAARLLVLGYRITGGEVDVLVAGAHGPEWVDTDRWDRVVFHPGPSADLHYIGNTRRERPEGAP